MKKKDVMRFSCISIRRVTSADVNTFPEFNEFIHITKSPRSVIEIKVPQEKSINETDSC